jgi:hypothetical protein
MKIFQCVVFLVLSVTASMAFGGGFSSPPPPPATAYEVTPGYNWFDPTKREYYGNRIPGTKYCVSGCTPEVIEQQKKDNANIENAYKERLRR